GRDWINKRDLRGVLPIFLLFIHLGQFYKNQNKNFLGHSLSLLSPQQKAITYKREVQFLDRAKLIKAPIKADHNGLSYLSNPSLSLKTLTLQPEADLVISMNPQLESQKGNEQKFKMIDKGEALYLYKKN
ncbi:MAG: hypothetical protein NXH75_17185, partial [Halobacteriovoraceae bacterium]|nr:hypothetical protein [Halobacteriovoraceae bacterium]